jgi:hypothetical protein
MIFQDVTRTTIRAGGFTAFLDGQENAWVRIPEFLVWSGAGKWQLSAAYFNLCLGICIFQAVVLGIGAMSHKPSPQ